MSDAYCNITSHSNESRGCRCNHTLIHEMKRYFHFVVIVKGSYVVPIFFHLHLVLCFTMCSSHSGNIVIPIGRYIDEKILFILIPLVILTKNITRDSLIYSNIVSCIDEKYNT